MPCLPADFPEPIAGHTVSTGEWLIHLAVHLGYHLGQIDYHRRLVTGTGRDGGHHGRAASCGRRASRGGRRLGLEHYAFDPDQAQRV